MSLYQATLLLLTELEKGGMINLCVNITEKANL